MSRFKGTRGTIILIVLILMALSYYTYLSNRNEEPVNDKPEITRVQDVLLRDLKIQYPPSPKEVVKYYGEITQCFYSEEYSEEEQTDLALKIRELYDAELIADKTQEQYLSDLNQDIEEYKEKGIVISSFATSASTDVEYSTIDGKEYASLYCTFTLRQNTELSATVHKFLLRKDEEGHWKILGWTLADKEVYE
ncbi:MAG: hypothetical protein PHT89_06180 [Lachnospiraceae bacterium]|nr:hypothetical protein [Lachnospiraceae bacterium]MDD3660300.1 hypothetical protein [Lachnospiraceae bacterium]